ncbi:MAG: cache domain-containing protein, partial [Bacteriovorax sp.]
MNKFDITESTKTNRPYSFVQTYEFEETRSLVSLVNDAAELVKTLGESSFEAFRESGKWRQKDMYIFVLDPEGNMLVHPDPALAGINTIDLKDVNDRPIIRGLIDAATAIPDKPEGWYHYQWPEPGDMAPRWKSSFVKLVKAPTGKSYVVGSGMYNDRMEKSFVIDMVKDAVALIEKIGQEAFLHFHDESGRFMAKDAYIFVFDSNGIELVNPAHPNLEGRMLFDVKDTNNKHFVHDFFKVVKSQGSGWVNYMWPKPGDSVSTEKSTYVEKANFKGQSYLVGCGVYLSNAPRGFHPLSEMTAPKLMQLVREGSKLLESDGETAYSEFRKRGSKWFKEDTYFFVWDMDGTCQFDAAEPSLEGKNRSDAKDILGRSYGKMILEIASS